MMRALPAVCSKTHYFIDRGLQRGVTYDALKQFEDEFNTKRKTGNLRVHVVFLPTSRDKLQAALLEGRGDIVAANVTQTPAREELADFVTPTYSDVKELTTWPTSLRTPRTRRAGPTTNARRP
jgi:membrane-bound lytic murein transglycosylase MltF